MRMEDAERNKTSKSKNWIFGIIVVSILVILIFSMRGCISNQLRVITMVNDEGGIIAEIPVDNMEAILSEKYGDAYYLDSPQLLEEAYQKLERTESEDGELLLFPQASKAIDPKFTIDTSYFPIPLDQRYDFPVNKYGKGSCTAWASVYYLKSYQEAREAKWTFSRDKPSKGDSALIHHPSDFAKLHNMPFNNGSKVSAVLSKLRIGGSLTLGDKEDKDALRSKITHYPTIYNQELSALLPNKLKKLQKPNHMKSVVKELLFREYPLVAEIVDFNSISPIPEGDGANSFHAVLLIGYTKNEVIFLNSFGRKWGGNGMKNGFGKMSFNDLFSNAQSIILSLDNNVDRVVDIGNFYDLIYNGESGKVVLDDRKVPLSLDHREINRLADRTPEEIITGGDIVVKLKDHRRDHLLEIHKRFPCIEEYGPRNFDQDKIELIGICSELDLNVGLRTWGRLTPGSKEGENIIAYFTLLDEAKRTIGTVEQGIQLQGDKFSSTIPLNNDIALSQVRSIILERVEYISDHDQYALCLEEEIVEENLKNILLETTYNQKEYLKAIGEIKEFRGLEKK